MPHSPSKNAMCRKWDTPVFRLQLLEGRIQGGLIVPFDGLNAIIAGEALVPGAGRGGIHAPGDEAEEAKGKVDVGEEGGINLLGKTLASSWTVLRPVFKIPDQFSGHREAPCHGFISLAWRS